MADGSLEKFLHELAETGTRLKLAPGVVGKGSMMWLGAVLMWAGIVFKFSPDHLVFDGALFLVGLVVTRSVALETQKMRDYAKENPSGALLEGAEFVAYKRFEAQQKELPAGDKSPPVPPGKVVIVLPAENPEV